MNITITVGSKLGLLGMGSGGYKLAHSLVSAGNNLTVICYGSALPAEGFRVKTVASPDKLSRFLLMTPLRFRTSLIYSLLNDYFDRNAARYLEQSEVIYSYTDQALLTLQRQKRISSHTVRFIHAANSHISLHHSLLTEEHRRYNMPQSLTSVLSVKKIKAEYKTTDYIRAQSKWVQQTLLENGVPAEKVFYVPPAVDLERYRPAAQLPENFTACFVGSFDLRKGVQYLLPAWTKTSPAIPQATLIMHGGAGSRWMNRFLTPYREFPGINWVGGGSADPTYAKSSVCVVPSIEDGFCYVVLEAMASGLPVIVSEHVGAKELVVEGVNGFVVPIRDSAAIAERLLWFYRNPEKLQIMGGAARATAEKYSYTMEGQRLSKAFEERLA